MDHIPYCHISMSRDSDGNPNESAGFVRVGKMIVDEWAGQYFFECPDCHHWESLSPCEDPNTDHMVCSQCLWEETLP